MTEASADITDKSTEEVVVDLNGQTVKSEKPHNETSTLKPEPRVIPAKRIDELTDEDKKILIDNARAGIDNPYFDVKLFKNGNTRICKKKKPTVSHQAVMSNGERIVKNQTSEQKIYMTDNQLIWEHLLELESKYNNLYRKHKKLKSKYNDLYIEDERKHKKLKSKYNDLYIEDEGTEFPSSKSLPVKELYAPDSTSHVPINTKVDVMKDENNNEPVDEPPVNEPVREAQPQKSYVPLRGGNWRTAPSIPEWYANFKYSYDKPFRESYIDNALNPYMKAYGFYTLRDSLKKQQLQEAATLEKQRQAKLKERGIQRSGAKWRDKVKFVL